MTTDDRGRDTDPEGVRDHLLSVMAEIIDDETIELVFVYSQATHDRPEIEELATLVVASLEQSTSVAV